MMSINSQDVDPVSPASPAVWKTLGNFLRRSVVSYAVHLFLGMIYGLPALVLASVFAPGLEGYIFVGILTLVLIHTLDTVNGSGLDEHPLEDMDLTASQFRLLVMLMELGTTFGVTLIVLASGSAGWAVATIGGIPLAGLVLTMAIPLLDNFAKNYHSKWSLSGIGFLSVFYIYRTYRQVVGLSVDDEADAARGFKGPII